jgi:molecular chaperone IbpA
VCRRIAARHAVGPGRKAAGGGTLTISGRVNERQGEAEYLYRGIAGRPFERRFNLADYVEVKRASFEDGLLQIELER